MQRKKRTPTARFLLYLQPELLEKIRQEATRHFRSVNGEVRWILEEHFAQRMSENDER